MKAHWTDNAEKHLDTIHDYIAQNSPEYAKIVVRGRRGQIFIVDKLVREKA